MAGVNVRTFQDLPSSVSIQDIEVYVNGKYKMSGLAFVNKLILGLGVRKVAQPPQIYSGLIVDLSIEIYVGEDWEVFRNGVLVNVGYVLGGNGLISQIIFPDDLPLDNDEVYVVKREIYSKI